MYEHDDHEDQTNEGWITIGILAVIAISLSLAYYCDSITIITDVRSPFQDL